ncbi:hypothetical protein ACA910_016108 [Epithemia clementina (nom. ined.)]
MTNDDEQINHARHVYTRIVEADECDELTPNVENAQTRITQQQQQGTNHDETTTLVSEQSAQRVERNFRWMSILFGANHASVVSCLSLATARFAAVGAWQSGILYVAYVASALFGATGVVQSLGGRNALVAGMALYCVYVAAFLVATLNPEKEKLFAYLGAAIGGIGAGFLWTAQGAYFALAAQEHARALGQPREASTNSFSSIFAFYYLSEEVLLRAISSLSGSIHAIDWTFIFSLYFLVALVSTIGMLGVHKFEEPQPIASSFSALSTPSSPKMESLLQRSTLALQLLVRDPKMKYMIGLNAVFGFSAAFLGSYVNGEVTQVVFGGKSNMVGLLTAWLSIVAAFMSTVFERVAKSHGKGSVLVAGSVCFALVALPFVLDPNIHRWTPLLLIFIYTMQGTGRATFEGTLKAVFADFFPSDKEGAFANIILQNGSASAIGYALSFGLKCEHETNYCVRFRDGSLHDVRTFEWLVIGTSVLAIFGFWRAAKLHKFQTLIPHEDNSQDPESSEL